MQGVRRPEEVEDSRHVQALHARRPEETGPELVVRGYANGRACALWRFGITAGSASWRCVG